MRVACWVALCVVTGCGGTTPQPQTTEPGSGSRAAAPPPTVWDPPAYSPAPGDEARTGHAVGLPASGGYDQARAVALRVIRAIRDQDEAMLERLLDDRVARLFPRLGGPMRPRTVIVRTTLHHPRRQGLGPDTGLDTLIDVEQIEVVPLARERDDGPIPAEMQGSDLKVTFPLQPQGRRWFRFLLGWSQRGGVVVRPGSEPRVVAM